jgi:small subunit ribosomal protein S21
MAKVTVREGETIEQALRRFKLEVKKAGIKEEAESHRFYEKPSVVRKRKEAQKKRRIKQRERYNR